MSLPLQERIHGCLLGLAVGDAVGARKMDEFLNVETSKVKMREIAQEVAKQVDSQTRDTMGVQIVDLQINGFDLPTQNRNSVILRMRAERDRIATRYKSEGDQEALRIEAEAAAEEQRILAEAKAKAESVRGSGEADALKIFADAYTQDPEFYRFLRSLDSYETLIDEDTTIVIESDSPLLDTLNGK